MQMATPRNDERRRRWFTLTQWSDHEVRNSIGFVVLASVNVAAFAALAEFVAYYTVSDDETESVNAPGLDATPQLTTQQLYLQYAALFRRLALLLPLLIAVFVRKATALPPTARNKATFFINACIAVLLLLALALPVVLYTTYSATNAYTARMAAHDPHVVATFNAYYCNVRGTAWCASDAFATLVPLLGGDNSTTATAASDALESPTAAAIARTLRRCQHLLVANRGGLSLRQTHFLASCNASDAVDAWCSDAIAQHAWQSDSARLPSPAAATLYAAAQTTTTMPATLLAAKFVHFAAVWQTQLLLDAFVLSLVALFVLVLVRFWLAVPDAYARWDAPALEAALAHNQHPVELQPLAVSASDAFKTK